MYARLWWKDARQFWPIWLVLVLGAAATQWAVIIYVGRPARFGALGVSALLWASLYALTAGAAAFAGERETGTLRLLDVLPADRKVVWAGKVSFALATSLALALLLLLMAAWSTELWNPQRPLTPWEAVCCGMVVLVALGWGLFWSSILKTAITAAVAAIFCSGWTILFVVLPDLDLTMGGRPFGFTFAGFTEIIVIIATTVASDVFFTRRARLRRMHIEFRSPVVLTREQSPRPRRMQVQSPVAVVPDPAPRPMAEARTLDALTGTPSIRSSWLVEARTLARQTIKEGIRTWFLLATITIVPSALLMLAESYIDSIWLVLVSGVVVLVAGASVFGLENRAKTQRFLVHHGARPGLVWFVKVSVWVIGLTVIGFSMASLARMLTIAGASRVEWAQVVLTLPLFFTVAMLCGMAMQRGITALVIGLVISFFLAVPLTILVYQRLLPASGLLFVPAVLLAVSWAWTRDWMLDRPAPGRWLRLGALLTASFALLSATYVGFRLWRVPDVGPIAKPAAWNDAPAGFLSADRNAAGLYRESGRYLLGPTSSPEFLARNKESLDLVRRAAARPECWFELPDKRTFFNHTSRPSAVDFARLLSLDARDRMGKGDLAGSWNDIMALFRMARHFSEGSGLQPAMGALTLVERDGLGLGMEWALARGQTTERLHTALAAYREMPKMPTAADILPAEANIGENTFDLPTGEFRDGLAALLPHGGDQWLRILVTGWITTPWERARARRVNRLISAHALRIASKEPADRPEFAEWGEWGWSDPDVPYALNTTPALIRGLFGFWVPYVWADDRNEVARRALVQIMAIRAWQLRHGGQFLERLDALVPEELPSLPNDPYSGQPFGYVRSRWGERVRPLRVALVESANLAEANSLEEPPDGAWLLYSVGPDRGDQEGRAIGRPRTGLGTGPSDIVFAIPPVEGASGPAKDKVDGAAKDRLAPATPR